MKDSSKQPPQAQSMDGGQFMQNSQGQGGNQYLQATQNTTSQQPQNSNLDVNMPNFGSTTTSVGASPIQSGFAGGGNIQGSVAGGGPLQSAIGGAGNVQRSADLSGLGDWARQAGYGNIQNNLDMSKVPGLVSGDALRGMTDEARNAAYQSASAYLNPQWDQRQKDMEAKLVNQGVAQGSDAWNNAMGQMGRERTFDYEQARNSAFQQGLAAQSQLFGQGLASNQNAYQQALGAGQFANIAQQQGFGQSLANANLQNTARQAAGNEAMQQMVLGNAAQQQQFGQNLAGAQLNNSAQQQQFAQNLAQGQFGNQAQQQRFGQNLAGAQFGNQAQQQQFAQGLANAQLGNSAQNQLASQWLNQYGTQRGAQATENAANAAAGASMANTNANLAAQAQQNAFNNSLLYNQQQWNQGWGDVNNTANLLNSLYGGAGANGGVNNPNFINGGQTNINPADIAGAFNNQYNGQLNAYNTQVGSQNSQNNAVAMIAAAMLSDRRLKKDVRQIGVHAGTGVPVYEYDYVWGERAIGVMADELERVRPDLVVTTASGYKAVLYGGL